jgi:hypothetical protein
MAGAGVRTNVSGRTVPPIGGQSVGGSTAGGPASARSIRIRTGIEVVVGLGLVGALLFGLIHIVGGTWHDNPQAVEFGVGLAGVSGVLLAGLVVFVRRQTRAA